MVILLLISTNALDNGLFEFERLGKSIYLSLSTSIVCSFINNPRMKVTIKNAKNLSSSCNMVTTK